MIEKLAKEIPQLARGQVWCIRCGNTKRMNSVCGLRYGWPKCCGETMTIDSPAERRALEKK